MLTPVYTKAFERDIKRYKKRNKDMTKLKVLIRQLCHEEPLELKYKDHALIGNYNNRRESHIEPDWLLIYKPEKSKQRIIFERTGSHSDLFK